MYMDKEYYFFRNSEFHETEQHETLSSEKSSTLYRFPFGRRTLFILHENVRLKFRYQSWRLI